VALAGLIQANNRDDADVSKRTRVPEWSGEPVVSAPVDEDFAVELEEEDGPA
jgi:hypothetical protein